MLMWEVYETGFFGSVRYHVIIRFKCTLMAFSVIRCCDVILALKCALQPRCIHPKLYDWTFLIRKTSMDMSKKFVLLAVKIDINIFIRNVSNCLCCNGNGQLKAILEVRSLTFTTNPSNRWNSAKRTISTKINFDFEIKYFVIPEY